MGSGIIHAEVPLGPLREAFAQSGLSFAEVARRTGWDANYVSRNLRPDGWGYSQRRMADGTKRFYRSRYYSVCYENAVKFAEALNVDPVDVGL
jgi:transcriptional regulator with XRE-family HTH domain